MSRGERNRAELVAALMDGLRQSSTASVMLSQAVASRLGINPADLEALELLHRTGPVTAGTLAEATGLTTGAITGMVDRLERAGFARRERDPVDRRRVYIRADRQAGEQAIAPLFASMARAMVALCAEYRDEELALLADFITRANALTIDETTKLRQEPRPPGGRDLPTPG